jgi:uncharacterized membrane protein YfcA
VLSAPKCPTWVDLSQAEVDDRMNLPLVLMSFLAGVLIGLTSMGGAALMAPFLILVVGVKPVTAVGTDLVYGAVTKVIGAWVHLKQGTVDLALVRKLAVGSVPGGIVGSAVVILLPQLNRNAELYVQKAMGGILVLVAVTLVVRMFFRLPTGAMSDKTRQFLHDRGTVIWGCVVGFFVGSTSIGSGSLLAPLLIALLPSAPSKVVGTDVFHAAILVSVTGLTHAGSGHIEWALIPSLLAGSIPGVLLGSRLAVWMPAKPLRTCLAALLLATGYRML